MFTYLTRSALVVQSLELSARLRLKNYFQMAHTWRLISFKLATQILTKKRQQVLKPQFAIAVVVKI